MKSFWNARVINLLFRFLSISKENNNVSLNVWNIDNNKISKIHLLQRGEFV